MPDMVLDYVEDHSYRPPQLFSEAVLRAGEKLRDCPRALADELASRHLVPRSPVKQAPAGL